MIGFGCVSSRTLWVKLRFSRVKVCAVLVYSPTEREGEERERFWNDLDRVGNGYRLCVLGYLNGWVGYKVRESITDAFGVPGENENRRAVDFCVV